MVFSCLTHDKWGLDAWHPIWLVSWEPPGAIPQCRARSKSLSIHPWSVYTHLCQSSLFSFLVRTLHDYEKKKSGSRKSLVYGWPQLDPRHHHAQLSGQSWGQSRALLSVTSVPPKNEVGKSYKTLECPPAPSPINWGWGMVQVISSSLWGQNPGVLCTSRLSSLSKSFTVSRNGGVE